MLLAVDLPEAQPGWHLDLEVVRRTRTLELDPHVTILVGENGSGKSTLLDALAMAAELPTVGRHDAAANDPGLRGRASDPS